MSRNRIWIGLLVAAAAVAAGIGIWSGAGPRRGVEPLVKVVVGAYAGDTGALVYIAADRGFFAANGLDVTIRDFEAGKLAADALLAGEVDISTSAEFVFVSNSFVHRDLRVMGTIATARSNELVVRRDRGIFTASDLRGRRIGVTRKSTGEFFLGRCLLFSGLSIRDVEIIDLNPSEIVNAMIAGEIDAAATWDPNAYQIRKELKLKTHSLSARSGQAFYFILLTRDSWLKSHPAAAERFLRSVIQAQDFVSDHSDDARRWMGQRFDYDPAYLQYSWAKHRFVVTLPQALLLAVEDEARWMIENEMTNEKRIPNYLDFLWLDGLDGVRPQAISIIR